LNSHIKLSGIKQLLRETNERIDSEIKDFSKNLQLPCQDCATINIFVESYGEICSICDVLKLESLCVEEITFYGNIMSEEKLPIKAYGIIAALSNKAKTDPIFKKKVKLYQRISSMILYFMQFIPEYKLTPCMRYVLLLAEKSVKMRI
jgi:hypothetical protein